MLGLDEPDCLEICFRKLSGQNGCLSIPLILFFIYFCFSLIPRTELPSSRPLHRGKREMCGLGSWDPCIAFLRNRLTEIGAWNRLLG